MLLINVSHDLDKLVAQLDVFSPDQLPFATANALNDTAFQARDAIQKQMPSRFTLRREAFMLNGVVVSKASKQTLTTIVFDRHTFMTKQETGGIAVSLNGKKYLAVPMPDIKRTGGGSVANADMLRNLGQFQRNGDPKSGNVILIPAKDGRLYIAVREHNAMRGAGRKGNTTAQTGLRLIWELKPETHYQARYSFGETVSAIVAQRFAENFGKQIKQAMASARPR